VRLDDERQLRRREVIETIGDADLDRLVARSLVIPV
jgi:hypothetical protein